METMDNEVLQALSARKSVRVYTDEPVTEAERNAILQAAFQAPTAGNQQLYTILNITDPALKARLADLCIVTEDNSVCAHYEHTIAINEHGLPELLTYPGYVLAEETT